MAEGYAAGNIELGDFRRTAEALQRRASEAEARIREQAPEPRIRFAWLAEEPSILEWNDCSPSPRS